MARYSFMEVKNLTLVRNKKRILNRISFRIYPQGINWIFGPNGSGKTSLLKILGRIETNYQGDLPSNLICAGPGQIGFLLEQGAYFSHMTIRENLSLFQRTYKISSDKIINALDFWGLTPYRGHKVRHLSVGIKSRFSLVLALVNQPKFILLDEPDGALDFQGNLLLRSCVESWRSTQGMVVIVSHHPHNIISQDYLLVLDGGTSIYQGSAKEFLDKPYSGENEYLTYLHKAIMKDKS